MGKIGGRVAYIRASNNQTMEAFGSVVGLSKGNISRLEKHQYDPSYKALVEIAQHYSVNPDWLLFGRGDVFVDSQVSKNLENIEENTQISFRNKSLAIEINRILRKIEDLDQGHLREIKGLLRSELDKAKGEKLLKTAEQQFKELEDRISRIEQAAHIHENDKLRHDDPPDQKEKILNRRSMPSPIAQ